LHKGNGKQVAVLEDNAALKEYISKIELPEREFFTFTTERGDVLNAYIKKPNDFDPTKKYPVLITQYSGPGSQEVNNRWGIGWEDALVQEGYLVVSCDPRGTGFRSADFKKSTYGIMGRLETEDQISFGKYLKTLPYVDAERVGIYGWSFGGFMSLNCILKGADVFKMAISVAPVTSWRYYDSVYTERVNGLPQNNAEGYDEPSPIGYAKNLKGKLLLMHGSADDNVHVQNAFAMAHEFVLAGKQIDMMIFPDDNHSMYPYGSRLIRQKMIAYCLENL
jgi:dipeptidyl-peptidase-4